MIYLIFNTFCAAWLFKKVWDLINISISNWPFASFFRWNWLWIYIILTVYSYLIWIHFLIIINLKILIWKNFDLITWLVLFIFKLKILIVILESLRIFFFFDLMIALLEYLIHEIIKFSSVIYVVWIQLINFLRLFPKIRIELISLIKINIAQFIRMTLFYLILLIKHFKIL